MGGASLFHPPGRVHHSRRARIGLSGAALLAICLAGGAPAAAAIWPTEGWTPATPQSMGLDSVSLAQARDYAIANGGGSGFITRGGRVVMTWGSTTDRYDLKSTTKSIGVTILGLAVKDGLVATSDGALQHYAGFGVPPASNGATGWLDDITLEQLATHTGGFARTGGFGELLFAPGTTWSYSDGGANWLGDVLTVRFGQDLRTVLFDRVLDHLGVTTLDLTWRDNAYRGTTIEGIPRRELGSGMHANVDAMARLGYLYLRGGKWDGLQIVPTSFVDAARVPSPAAFGRPVADSALYPGASGHYGLLWWNNAGAALPGVPTDAYWSWGLDESFIIVIPSLDLVVARAGGAWQTGFSTDYAILEPFLAPIVAAVEANPTNHAPLVSAGPDREIAPPGNSLTLQGSVQDDGLPSESLTALWTKKSGPGTVAFGSPASATTGATFGSDGVYVLRLTASDGSLAAWDETVVSVGASSGITAHWRFDDGSGTIAHDSSQGGNSGSLLNGPAWTAGRIGGALAFDGVDDAVGVVDPGTGSALDLGADFTIGAWVRFSSLPANGAAAYPRVLQKSASASAAGSYYLAARTGAGPAVASLRLKFGGATYTLDGTTALTTGRWYRVVAVKEGSSARLYLDGLQDGPTYTLPAGAPDANDDPLYIGEAPSNTDGAFAGSIDDVRLYGRALSDTEIAIEYGDVVTSAPVSQATGAPWLRFESLPSRSGGGTTTFAIHAERPTTATLQIFDVRGRLVKTLLSRAPIAAGSTTVSWRGATDRGVGAASGVYFARLRAGGETLVRRVLQIK
ncbi:MAG TPA: LamG-like jellyroll fold domain-containing protein [Candidatus Eisenbacteria bacterium]|nr:LamG-like jellyroll fold domain-containing protein [Candidatus Eisenbacteria bacterium]